MFGKNDGLADPNYRHTPATPLTDAGFEPTANEAEPAAPAAPTPPNFEEQIFADPAAEHAPPTYEAPVSLAPEAPAPQPENTAPAAEIQAESQPEAPVPAPHFQPAELPASFKELMERRALQQTAPLPAFEPQPITEQGATEQDTSEFAAQPIAPAQPESVAAPAAEADDELTRIEPLLGDAEPLNIHDLIAEEQPAAPTAEAAAEAPAEPPAQDLPAAEPQPAEPPAAPPPANTESLASESPLLPNLPLAQTKALLQMLDVLEGDDIGKSSGKTRLQAAALKALTEKALTDDVDALGQLRTYGYDLLEKLADGLPPASRTLANLIDNAGALVGSGVVVAADGKAQQAELLRDLVQNSGQSPRNYQERIQAEKQTTTPGGIAF